MIRIEYVPDSEKDCNSHIKIELMCPGCEYNMKDYLIAFRAFMSGMSWTIETIDENIVDPYSSNYIVRDGE